jgi:hypothetical protein
LRRIQPDAGPDEAGFLNAFDSNRDLICDAAAKIYVRGSRGSYVYVPNVVYTCVAMRHNDQIILPYAISDTFSNLATIKISTLLNAMQS